MKILDLPQGSELWKEERRRWATASDMPSILGVKGAFSSRKRLLAEKRTGVDKPVSPTTQAIFDRGHAVEVELRAWCEAKLGMRFEPVVMLDEKAGILASIDCWNAEYRVLVETKNSTAESKLVLARNYEVWQPYLVQILTQMLVAKPEVAFLCMRDDVTGDNYLIPVEEDKQIMRKISTEAKKFVKELNEQD